MAALAPSVVPVDAAVPPHVPAGGNGGLVLFGPSVPASNSGSLYVGDLTPEVTEATLFEIFNSVGPVASVRLCRDATSRRSLGYGYVNFVRSEDAERAIDTMNFKEIRGRQCRIMWSHRDPTLRRTGRGNIYVKNLDKTIDNKTLYDTFSMFGDILSCKVASDAEKNSLGYGFVHFASDESALKAIERTNGKQIGDSVVQVMPFKTRQEREAANPQRFNNLYVKHFPANATVESVKALFAPFGNIISCHLPVNAEGKLVGFGYVCYSTADEAVAALKALHDSEVEGTKLYVARHQKKEEREKDMREKRDRQRFERLRKFANVNLYVKNLSAEMTDDRLKQLFAEHGSITSARVMRDQSGASRQFGFVCFSAPEEATKAVTSLNGFIVDGKPLYVTLAQQKDARRQQLEMARMNRMQYIQPQMANAQMANAQMPFVNMGQMMFPGMPQQRFAAYPQQPMPMVQGLPQRWPMQQPGVPMMGMPRNGGFPMGPRGMPAPMPLMAAPGMPPQQQGQPGGQPGQPQGQQGQPRGPAQGGNRGPKSHRGGAQVPPQQAQVPQPGMVMGLPQGGAPMQMGPKPVVAAPGGVAQPQQMLYAEVVRAEQAAHAQMAAAHAAAGGAPVPVAAASVQVPVPVEAVMLSAAELAAAPEEVRKQMIGERLYPRVSLAVAPELAGKITGMLIEMDVAEVLHLLDSQPALDAKIQEALAVLRQHNSAA